MLSGENVTGQVYHHRVNGRSGECSKLCQCRANGTVVCRSLPCIDGLQCTHRSNIYGQLLNQAYNNMQVHWCIISKILIKCKLFTALQYWVNERYMKQTERQINHETKHFRWWNVYNDTCIMGRWSFWSWFDVNRSTFLDEDMREKRLLHFRSQWPWPFTFTQICFSSYSCPLQCNFAVSTKLEVFNGFLFQKFLGTERSDGRLPIL